MKKATIGLIGALLVTMVTSNAWAQSGIRIDLVGSGIGFSIYDGRSNFPAFSYDYYRPYPYNYSRYYQNRPYFGWGGYRGHQHHRHNHWGHHKPNHRHKGHRYGHQRSHKRGDHGRHQRKHHRHNRHRHHLHR